MQITDVIKELERLSVYYSHINEMITFNEITSQKGQAVYFSIKEDINILYTRLDNSKVYNNNQYLSFLAREWTEKIETSINDFLKSSLRMLNIISLEDYSNLINAYLEQINTNNKITISTIIDELYSNDISDIKFSLNKYPKINKTSLTRYLKNCTERPFMAKSKYEPEPIYDKENEIQYIVAEDSEGYIKANENKKYDIEIYKLITNSIFTPFENDYTKLLLTYQNINTLVSSLNVLYTRDLLAPLPPNFNLSDEKKHNLIIRSNTHHNDLIKMSEDMNKLSEIIELLISLNENPSELTENKNQPNYTLRRLSTGTFEAFITLYMPMAKSIGIFIFIVIHLISQIQQLKEHDQKIKNKKIKSKERNMKIITDCLDNALKVQAVYPEDKLAKKVSLTAMKLSLEYLGDNNIGTINGEDYSLPKISTSEVEEIILDIEEMILEIEESTTTGDE